MAVYEIPTGPSQCTMTVALGGTTYGMRLAFADAPEGGWFLDLSDVQGNPLLCGAPLVEGADILGQYAYLGVPGHMWVMREAGSADLSYDNLSVTWHLLYEDPSSAGAYLAAYLATFAED